MEGLSDSPRRVPPPSASMSLTYSVGRPPNYGGPRVLCPWT